MNARQRRKVRRRRLRTFRQIMQSALVKLLKHSTPVRSDEGIVRIKVIAEAIYSDYRRTHHES